jgi:hypothetical protein
MSSFRDDVLGRLTIPLGAVRLLTEIAEAKGRQEALMRRVSGSALEELRQRASRESVESSCRLAGITVAPDRLRQLAFGDDGPGPASDTHRSSDPEVTGYNRGVTDQETALRILAALRSGPVGDDGVLVGSSGLFGFETAVPALTEDIDIAVPEATVARQGREIVEALQAHGFEHEPGTASFLGPGNAVFDLLGHGQAEEGDHTAGGDALRVMVFEDLSRLLADPRSTMELPGGGRALTPAGFVAAKLLTERAHKGSKDKLQALLVLAERAADEALAADVSALLAAVDRERLADLRAAAQAAVFSLQEDPTFSDAGAEGYVAMKHRVKAGFARLSELLERLDA